ncbi:MAG TPA: hypothetical protein VHE99_00075 [Gammaproteobacteria bacterium]|nr:hypothetical protein [Gammaproteobacteria bacterium]
MLKLLQREFAFYYKIAIKKAPQPALMKKSQYANYLAIQILEEVNNHYPTQAEIDLIESLVLRHLNSERMPKRQSHKLNDSGLIDSCY